MFMANNAQHNVCCIRRPWASDNLPEENNTAVVHNRRTIGQEDKRETTVEQYNSTSTVPVKLYRMDGWMDPLLRPHQVGLRIRWLKGTAEQRNANIQVCQQQKLLRTAAGAHWWFQWFQWFLLIPDDSCCPPNSLPQNELLRHGAHDIPRLAFSDVLFHRGNILASNLDRNPCLKRNGIAPTRLVLSQDP